MPLGVEACVYNFHDDEDGVYIYIHGRERLRCEQKRLKGGFGVGWVGSVSERTKELEAWGNMGVRPTAGLVGPIIFVMSSTSHGDVKVCVCVWIDLHTQ